MRQFGRWTAAVLSVLLMGMVDAQTFYKWTDAHGTTHYGAEKPSVRATAIKIGPSPGGAPAAAASQMAPAPASAALDEAKSAFRKQACSTARSNLAVLSSSSMVLDTGSVADPEGIDRATKLSPEQRIAAKVAAQEQIHDYCDRR